MTDKKIEPVGVEELAKAIAEFCPTEVDKPAVRTAVERHLREAEASLRKEIEALIRHYSELIRGAMRERYQAVQEAEEAVRKEMDELREQVMTYQADQNYDERFAQGEDAMCEKMECVHPRACWVGLKPEEPCDRIGGCLHKNVGSSTKCKCDTRGYCSACALQAQAVKEAVEEEREACANIAEGFDGNLSNTALASANNIRRRGKEGNQCA